MVDWVTASRHFVSIVETGSFAEAARQRYTSASALSKQLAWLEDRLNTKLLHRTTRHLSLTEAGQVFYLRARKIIDDIHSLDQELLGKNGELSGKIRLTCAVAEQQSVLLQLFPKFLEAHPKISIDFITSMRQQDLAAEGFDLAIRRDYSPQHNLEQVLLGTIKIDIYGSPEYFSKHGEPKTPEDLLQHNCLIHHELSMGGRWEFRDKKFMNVSGNLSSNNNAALIEAARSGLGLIQISDTLIECYIHKGLLVPVLQKYSQPCIDIYAVYPKQVYQNKLVLAFIDFLKENRFCSMFCRDEEE